MKRLMFPLVLVLTPGVSMAGLQIVDGFAAQKKLALAALEQPGTARTEYRPAAVQQAAPVVPKAVAAPVKSDPVLSVVPVAVKPAETAKVIVPAVMEKPAPAKWEIRLSDKTIFGAMKKWAKAAGWQLMWDTEGNDFPVVAEATYTGEFDAAIGGVMASLQRSQYPMRACLYENRAVRVIHKSKRCEG